MKKKSETTSNKIEVDNFTALYNNKRFSELKLLENDWVNSHRSETLGIYINKTLNNVKKYLYYKYNITKSKSTKV